jgi:hypothetical protein
VKILQLLVEIDHLFTVFWHNRASSIRSDGLPRMTLTLSLPSLGSLQKMMHPAIQQKRREIRLPFNEIAYTNHLIKWPFAVFYLTHFCNTLALSSTPVSLIQRK